MSLAEIIAQKYKPL